VLLLAALVAFAALIAEALRRTVTIPTLPN
jgi:hypothetical protein